MKFRLATARVMRRILKIRNHRFNTFVPLIHSLSYRQTPFLLDMPTPTRFGSNSITKIRTCRHKSNRKSSDSKNIYAPPSKIKRTKSQPLKRISTVLYCPSKIVHDSRILSRPRICIHRVRICRCVLPRTLLATLIQHCPYSSTPL
jgi:hypothetical protein